MLIPLYNPTEEQMYQMCQNLKDLYADNAVVGVYAEYFCDGHWINHVSKTILKDNKVDGVEYQVMPMEEISTIDTKFDIIISSLAFHYIKDYNKLIKDIYNLLNENGILLFSQEHPTALATIKEPYVSDSKIELNNKRFYLLSDYNRSGIREMIWNGEKVIKYHRTISELINGLIENGFIIDKIKEPIPSEEAIEKVPKYIYQYDRPYFIFIKAQK